MKKTYERPAIIPVLDVAIKVKDTASLVVVGAVGLNPARSARSLDPTARLETDFIPKPYVTGL